MAEQNHHKVQKVVFNDRLGYAVVYYDPIGKGGVKVPKSEDICERRRQQIINPCNDQLDVKFSDEIEAMVRKNEREAASKEIEKICDEISDLYREVEQQNFKHRDILNYRVREQIKGKSAKDICDIIVQDVLNHTKPTKYIREVDTFPHKMKYKILSAGIQRTPLPQRPPPRKYFETNEQTEQREKEETQNVLKRVEDYLAKHPQNNIHHLKYKPIIDKIQTEIVYLKRRCIEKIKFT